LISPGRDSFDIYIDEILVGFAAIVQAVVAWVAGLLSLLVMR
jgi:hypothetical protein